MPDAGELSLETFSSRVGERFVIRASDELLLEATLASAEALASPGHPADRVPFSILFRGPREPILPQRIYRIEQDALGSVELFLVPLEPDADGARYQAIFA